MKIAESNRSIEEIPYNRIQLKEFYIENLFYKKSIRYNIPLKEDRITILYGLNGSGKTTVLKILHLFFTKSYLQLSSIPFDFFELIFNNGSTLRVYKNRYFFEKKCIEKCINDNKYWNYIDSKFYIELFANIEIDAEGESENVDFFKEQIRKKFDKTGLIFEFEKKSKKPKIAWSIYEYNYRKHYSDVKRGWKVLEPFEYNGDYSKNDLIQQLENVLKILHSSNFEKIIGIDNLPKIVAIDSMSIEELSYKIEETEAELDYYLKEHDNPYDWGDSIIELYVLKNRLKYQKYIAPNIGHMITRGKAKEGEIIPPFINLITNIYVDFIETQRIFKIRSNESYDNQLKDDSNHLKDLIKKANEEFNLISREKEKTFFDRILIGDNIYDLPKERLLEMLIEVSDKEDLFNKLGILKDESKNKIDDPIAISNSRAETISEIDDYLEKTPYFQLPFSIKMHDTIEIFKPFFELSEKCTLFTKIIEKFFENKTVKFYQEEGIVFYDIEMEPNNQKIVELSLDQLSSGEKHMIVMLFDFIFKIPDGSLILIDEPELSLHITWQREFIRTIKAMIDSSGKEKIQVIIATHSPQIIHNRRDLLVSLGGVGNYG